MDDTEMAMLRRRAPEIGLFAQPEVIETSHPERVAGQSQAGQILRHLQTVGPLTSLDALRLFGCARLAARIADLRNHGYAIKSRFVQVGNNKRVSEYTLRA